MNKLFASVGALTIGAAAVHAGGVQMMDPTRPYSVSATLRGFYDDNYVTATKGGERDSFGIAVEPSIAFQVPLEQTTLGLKYTFGARWYQDREDLGASNDPWDFSHELDAFLNHQFSPRYSLDLSDSFVVTQEPELLLAGAPYRTEGDNLRNRAEATFTAVLNPTMTLVVGYQNTLVDYDNDGGNFITPSLSGLLDRMEQVGLVNLRWQARKDTVGVLGYNFGVIDYDGDETVAIAGSPLAPVTSDYRNNRSHEVYAGVDQNFSKDIVLTLRGGAQIMDYYNDPLADDTVSPFGQVSVNYKYLPTSSASLGWTIRHSPTDVIAVDGNGDITQDILSSMLFASLNHEFTPMLSGFVNGFWQLAEFNGGLYDGETQNWLGIGLGLKYRFNRNLSGEVGYNFDTLSSDLPGREYDRNRVYMGVTAAY